MRADGRKPEDLRAVKINRNYLPHAEGSVLFELGNTRVVCTASFENKVPAWRRGSGKGWLTAEYSMLPRSTMFRTTREATQGRVFGRTHEIQRLIGRSLRCVTDLSKLGGENTIWIDCDVIFADGGTRTASITGAFVALYDCCSKLVENGYLNEMPLTDFVAAVSVGVCDDKICLDLCYEEDCRADVDMNVVMDGSGKIIEIQGTGERSSFTRDHLDKMTDLAHAGIARLVELQRSSLFKSSDKVDNR